MSCPEFERKGYLYFFKELSRSEREEFKSHLKGCPTCLEELERMKETWRLMERMEQESPTSETRGAILRQARRRNVRTSIGERLRSWVNWWEIHRGLSWGMSAAVVIVILLFVLVRPFERFRPGASIEEETYAWQDDFIAQADWMEQEIDRIESGNLLASYYPSEDDYSEFDEDFVSPLSEDLNRIRGEVENLMETIYGI